MKIKALLSFGIALFTLQNGSIEALLAGVKANGMAATCIAYPIDAFAGAYNPAGIPQLCNRLDVGISWVQTYQKAIITQLPEYVGAPLRTPPPNGTFDPFTQTAIQPSSFNGTYNGAKTSDAYVPEFAIKTGWCFGNNRQFEIAAGFMIHNRNDLKTTYSKAFEFLGTSALGLDYLHENTAILLAGRFMKTISLGVSLIYNLQRLKIDGLEKFANPFFSIHPGNATNRGYAYSNGWGVIIGYLFEWKCFKGGASWSPKTSMGKIKKYRGFIAKEGSFDVPERFSAGASYRVLSNVVLAFDYEHIRWRGIPQLRNNSFPNLDFSASNLQVFGFGAPRGPGFGFRNQSFYRFGTEYKINKCLTVRAGFQHANNPIRAKFTTINLLTLSCMENIVTFGGTWRPHASHEFSFFYGIGMSKVFPGKNSIPRTIPQPIINNGNIIGRVDVPINAVESGNTLTNIRANGEVNLKQRRYGLGVSYGWYF